MPIMGLLKLSELKDWLQGLGRVCPLSVLGFQGLVVAGTVDWWLLIILIDVGEA